VLSFVVVAIISAYPASFSFSFFSAAEYTPTPIGLPSTRTSPARAAEFFFTLSG